MRILNARQKNILKAWVKKTNINGVSMKGLPSDIYTKLVAINDHETIYQNTERFIQDLRMGGLYKKS